MPSITFNIGYRPPAANSVFALENSLHIAPTKDDRQSPTPWMIMVIGGFGLNLMYANLNPRGREQEPTPHEQRARDAVAQLIEIESHYGFIPV